MQQEAYGGKPRATRVHPSHSVYDYSSAENSDASVVVTPRSSRSYPQLPVRAFDGKNWAGFKSQFEITCMLNNYTEEEKAGRLVNALSGDALAVLPKGKTCPTYKQLVQRLDEKYCSLRSDTDILNQLSEIMRQQDESCYDFASRVTALAEAANMSPEELPQVLFTAFHTGLKNFRDTQIAITKEYPNRKDWTLENAVRAATSYETVYGHRATSTNENIRWGTIAAAQPAGKSEDIQINAVAPHGERTPLFERVLKVEKELGALTKVLELLKEEAVSTRNSMREINNNLIELKTRYNEAENRRANYRGNLRNNQPRNQEGDGNRNDQENFRFGNRNKDNRNRRSQSYNNRAPEAEQSGRQA